MLAEWRGWVRIAGVLAVVVPATLAVAAPDVRASGGPGWHAAQEQRAVPGHTATARPAPADPGARFDLRDAPPVSWPKPGTALADPAPAGRAATAPPKARAGDLPVWIGPPSSAAGTSAGAAKPPAPAIQVRVLDARAAARSQITGLGLRLTAKTGPVARGGRGGLLGLPARLRRRLGVAAAPGTPAGLRRHHPRPARMPDPDAA
ncbi:hypothetical protein [Sphaerisporangium corydalis]|uniref:Uncharacterized protein n=1 Tax=Sphaerisporangium corydalis TaxID=1441875 RepID=A0ABV9EKL4_9ACTN|nr:hypothetical protein [Sphaerisporangium corydalis]